MSDLGDGRVGYRGSGTGEASAAEAAIEFVPAAGVYRPSETDVYWKIALGMPDVDLAVSQLQARGVAVEPAHQVADIAYLTHLADPEGFVIELLDHAFDGERRSAPVDEGLLGGGAHLNLLTLRTVDVEADAAHLERWGMRPLAVAPADDWGFTLHFFAFADEQPPNIGDLSAVTNRPWVYQRPYTVLELQHLHGGGPLRKPQADNPGYDHAIIQGLAPGAGHAGLGIREARTFGR